MKRPDHYGQVTTMSTMRQRLGNVSEEAVWDWVHEILSDSARMQEREGLELEPLFWLVDVQVAPDEFEVGFLMKERYTEVIRGLR